MTDTSLPDRRRETRRSSDAALRREVENLHGALQTREVIGVATGMIMQRYRLSQEKAFGYLTRRSQHGNVKLRDLALDVIRELQQERQHPAPPQEDGTPQRPTV
jgi:AmiR/NasT family two-component response regulator